jgi:hypothetical protein
MGYLVGKLLERSPRSHAQICIEDAATNRYEHDRHDRYGRSTPHG